MDNLDSRAPAFTIGHSNLYVKNLPFDADESNLQDVFQQFGEVQSIRIFRSIQHPQKSPIAFVKYGTSVEAQSAIEGLNGANLNGCVLEVKLADTDAGKKDPDKIAPPSDNVYIKNIPAKCSEASLESLFSQFGTVKVCRILHRGDLSPNGYGGAALIRMGSVEEASQAIQALNNEKLRGSSINLIVRYADNANIKAKKHAKQASLPPSYRFSPFNPPSTSTATSPPLQSNISESSAGILEGYSESVSIQAHRANMSSQEPSTSQPVFIPQYLPTNVAYTPTFANPVPGIYHVQHGGQALEGYAMPRNMAVSGHQQQNLFVTQPLPPVPHPSLPSTSVYVANLPPDVNRLFLYEKFSPFGPILSVHILTHNDGRNKGAGFVNFADSVSAARAVSSMNSVILGNRPLYVAFQTPRSQ